MKNLIKLPLLTVMLATFAFIGCQKSHSSTTDNKSGSATDSTAMQAKNSSMQMDDRMNMDFNKAVAVINSNDKDISAWVSFTKTDEGVHVHGEFSGFAEGMHAYHVHTYGDCRADDYSSAGPHLKFNKNVPKDAPIVGNLGEFMANPSGTAITDTTIAAIEFSDLLGRAVIVHEKGNNLNPPPTGNAGARIACGVIGRANPDFMTSDM